MSNHLREVRGVQKLAEEAVHHGSRIIEGIQKDTAKRTFDVLNRVPIVAPASRLVQTVFDASVSLSHTGIRFVNKAVHRTIDVALDVVDAVDAKSGSSDANRLASDDAGMR